VGGKAKINIPLFFRIKQRKHAADRIRGKDAEVKKRKRLSALLTAGSLLVFCFYLVGLSGSEAQVIENPEKPASANAGRIVRLEEIFRITDGDGDFFFKQPSDLKVAEDGTIFYADLDEKLYRFDASGKYTGSLVRRGEGPGEIRELSKIFLHGEDLFVFDSMSNKVIHLDSEGRFVGDTNLGQHRFDILLAAYKDRFFALDFMWRELKRKSGINLVDKTLHIIDGKGAIERTSYVFPIKTLMLMNSGSISMYNITNIHSAFDGGRFLYLAHTSDYVVKRIDLEHPESFFSFTKTYDPVKIFVSKEEKSKNSDFLKYEPEYHNDVQKLLILDDNILVLTSRVEKDKGIQTDVFDASGRYVDSFYLPLFRWEPGWWGYPPAAIAGEHLHTVEWDDDGIIYIVKYRIADE